MMLLDPQLELLRVNCRWGKRCPRPWMPLGGLLQPCRSGWEAGGGSLEESSKQQEGRGGFAPHSGPEEQRFGKGYSNALATSRETSWGLALIIPLLCLLDPFLHVKEVMGSGLSCCSFFLPV